MGQYFSTNRQGRVEELNISSNAVYRYPPKSGSYFGGHFVMGGKEFESMNPEGYLFGENSDLNYLSPKPQQFPYKPSRSEEPIKALRCLVNIRKDSLRLVKVASPMMKAEGKDGEMAQQIITDTSNGWYYNIEFTFDADSPCLITIYYNSTEEIVNKSVIYTSEPVNECSATVQYQAGCNQQFCLPSHMIHESKLTTSDGLWNTEFKHIPVVIQILAQNGPEHNGHSHITYAEFYKPSDTNWSIRSVKQKQAIDGVCYLLQEIYGIEHKKQNQEEEHEEEEIDSSNSECVVCLSDTRDTLILPCKHLCLCSTCANQLRYQQSGCPICRQSFRALLQIRAVRKKDPNADTSNVSQQSEEEVVVDIETSSQDMPEVPIPDGYEVVSLIDTVNGTLNSTSNLSTLGVAASPSHVNAEIASTSSDNVVTENEIKKVKVQEKSSKKKEEEEHVYEEVAAVSEDIKEVEEESFLPPTEEVPEPTSILDAVDKSEKELKETEPQHEEVQSPNEEEIEPQHEEEQPEPTSEEEVIIINEQQVKDVEQPQSDNTDNQENKNNEIVV